MLNKEGRIPERRGESSWGPRGQGRKTMESLKVHIRSWA